MFVYATLDFFFCKAETYNESGILQKHKVPLQVFSIHPNVLQLNIQDV